VRYYLGEDMKALPLIMIALAAIGFLSCTTDTDEHQNREIEVPSSAAFDILDGTTESASFNDEVFSDTFEEYLLSDDPLHYERSHALLNWVADLERNGDLSTQDRSLVANRLRRFLSRRIPRQVDPEGGMSGIAPPEGVLRTYAVRLLGMLGGQSDISFLEKVRDSYQAEHPEGFNHPWFIGSCNEAIDLTKRRNR